MPQGDYPVLIPSPKASILVPNLSTETFLFLGGIWGQVGSGQRVMASDGWRLIWSADNMSVVYSQNGQFYIQTASGFAGEIRTAPAIQAARSAAFMARVAEIEMKLMMGIVAGASGVGFAAVIGTEVLEFVVDNRDNFAVWQDQFKAVLQAREFLKDQTPVLYEKVFNAVLKQVYKDVKGQLPNSVTPKVVAFGIGVIIGSVGKKVAQGKLSLLVVIFAIVEQLAVRFCLSVVPGAIVITKDEYEKMAKEIITKVRDAGVTLLDLDAKKIIEEVRQHPTQVKQAFDILKEAFEKKVKQIDR